MILLNKETKHNYFDTLDTSKGFKPFRIVYKPYIPNINIEILWYCLEKMTNLQWNENRHYFLKFFSQTAPLLELYKYPEVLPNVPRPYRTYDKNDRYWPWFNIKANQA